METRPGITVAVHGATGRMGRVLLNAIERAHDLRLVGTASRSTAIALTEAGEDARLHDTVESLLSAERPDVVVDFSTRDAVLPLAKAAARKRGGLRYRHKRL